MLAIRFPGVSRSAPSDEMQSFVPVVGVMKVSSDEEAIRLMNYSSYGLTASVGSSLCPLDPGADPQRASPACPALAWLAGQGHTKGTAMSTFAFTAENGIPFVARRVDKGENYGRDERIAHQEDDPLIEFYDTRHPHTKYGQFVSRYYLSTLQKRDQNQGLCLDGGNADVWSIDSGSLSTVLKELSASNH
jgi:hypothetical protein